MLLTLLAYGLWTPDIGRPILQARYLDAPGDITEIAGERLIRLGPEPMIGAQSLHLRLGAQSLKLATDGLGPFEVSKVAVP